MPPGLDPEITLNVVLDAVSLVEKLPWLDSKRFYLYGFSRGAFFASLLANRIEGIKGVVLQSGAYDLNRFYQDTLWFRSMLNPNGEQNPKLVSILPQVPTWRAPTLVLHGGKDLLVSVQQANLLSESWRAPTNPTASFSIPMTAIDYRWKTSEERPPPFLQKPPDPPVVLLLFDRF